MQAEQEMQAAEDSQSEELSEADAAPEVPVPIDVVVVSRSPVETGMTQPRSTAPTAAAAAGNIVAAAANEHESATPAAGVVSSSQVPLAHAAEAPDVSFAPWMSDQLPLASLAATATPHPPAAAGPELGLPDLATLDELTALPDVPAHTPAHSRANDRQVVPARPVAEATEGSEADLDRQLEAATARAGLMQRPSTGVWF